MPGVNPFATVPYDSFIVPIPKTVLGGGASDIVESARAKFQSVANKKNNTMFMVVAAVSVAVVAVGVWALVDKPGKYFGTHAELIGVMMTVVGVVALLASGTMLMYANQESIRRML